MGYDLHITRKKQWSDEGDGISIEEWRALVERDPELRWQETNGGHSAVWSGPPELEEAWLDWSDADISSKNPDAAFIDKMVMIARELGATVQGDDGEIYEGGSQPPRTPSLSLPDRVFACIHSLVPTRLAKTKHPPLPFGVGDRVRDVWGNEHTVIAIDPNAEHRLGVIAICNDAGVEQRCTVIAHGLKPVQLND